jgi:Molecular chaperone GrpE (heat shock protein)
MSQIKLSSEILDRILNKIGTLLRQEVSLKQTLREQDSQNQSANEELFLELLEVVDALDFLMEYMANNPDPSPQFIQRLPKSVGSIQKKLLNILGKTTSNTD